MNMDVHTNSEFEMFNIISEFQKTGVTPTEIWLQHAESSKEVCRIIAVFTFVLPFPADNSILLGTRSKGHRDRSQQVCTREGKAHVR